MPKQLDIMGNFYPVYGQDEILLAIEKASHKNPVRIATLNPELILDSTKNTTFKKALLGMSHCSIDGFGLYAMLRLFNHRDIERYTGANLVTDLFERYADGSRRFYLLGGLGKEAVVAAEQLQACFPRIQIVGAESGGVINQENPLDVSLSRKIEATNPDILLVGFGAPKQEIWIQAASNLEIPVMLGIGGSFNFYGSKRRAPLLFQRLGIEWLYRGVMEPHHWHRVWRAVVIFPIYYISWQFTHAGRPKN